MEDKNEEREFVIRPDEYAKGNEYAPEEDEEDELDMLDPDEGLPVSPDSDSPDGSPEDGQHHGHKKHKHKRKKKRYHTEDGESVESDAAPVKSR